MIEESPEAIKRDLGIPFEKVVLFAGRMGVDGGRKRVDDLIEMFRDIEGRDAGLVIVGSGMRPEWEKRMNPETTIYLGEVHDPDNRQIARIFTMADVFAVPGHVGLGLNQALFFGLPVVTSGACGHAELLGDAACVVEAARDAAGFAAALDALADPEARARRGGLGSERVAGLGWPHIAARMRDVYLEIASEKRARARGET